MNQTKGPEMNWGQAAARLYSLSLALSQTVVVIYEQMKFVLCFEESEYNLYYLLQTNKCKILLFDLHLQGLILDLKALVFTRDLQMSSSL